MARPKAKAPNRTYHISGQSVVRLDGRDFYLGEHDSPESIARYAVLIAAYQAGGMRLPADFEIGTLEPQVMSMLGMIVEPQQQAKTPITVRHVTACFRLHIAERYANNPKEIHRLGMVCDALELNDGDLNADQYGPLALQRQRQRFVDTGKTSRPYVNRLTNAIVRIFKHAVSQELVQPEVWQRLKSVEPLRAGQTKAKERPPVRPVDIEVVRATAKHLTPVLKAMLRVQIATGMRPSEVCSLRPCDIDRTGPEWFWRPEKHKTAGRGIQKAVPILGDARAAIEDYMNRDSQSALFSPAESVAWWLAQKRANRKSKVQPSQQFRRVENPRKQPGNQYDSGSYRQALQRAAKAAKVQEWNPYQIRHLAATMVREALNAEAAQALLGHAELRMTEHYAKLSESKAIEAAKVAPKL
jgi:integrase